MRSITLPDIATLRKLMQSLAMLDAVLCPEWDMRYHSFDSQWAPDEAMASLRNGSGDSWHLHFTPHGAFFKGFAHESPMANNAPWPGVLDAVPPIFIGPLNEPAFSMQDTTFCVWRQLADIQWHHGPIAFPHDPDPDGWLDLTKTVDKDPTSYQQWAEDYFETHIDLKLVRAVFDFTPLNEDLIRALNPDLTVDDVRDDAIEIAYPISDRST